MTFSVLLEKFVIRFHEGSAAKPGLRKGTLVPHRRLTTRTIFYCGNIGPAPFGGNPTFVEALPVMCAAHRNISNSDPARAALTVIPVRCCAEVTRTA
ncbi:hypothetical protein ACSVBT_14250 [Afipia sp. TerB]